METARRLESDWSDEYGTQEWTQSRWRTTAKILPFPDLGHDRPKTQDYRPAGRVSPGKSGRPSSGWTTNETLTRPKLGALGGMLGDHPWYQLAAGRGEVAAEEASMMRFSSPRRRRVGGRWTRHYYCRVYNPATRRRSWRTTGCPTIRSARAWIERQRYEAALGPELSRRQVTIVASLVLFERELGSRAAAGTMRAFRAHARRWVASWGSQGLGDVTRETLAAYLSRRQAEGRSARTLKADRQWLRMFFRWAVEAGYLAASPAAGIRPFRLPDDHPRSLSEEEQVRVLRASELERPEARLAILLGLETGFRRGTLAALRWEWVDLEGGWIEVPAAANKARRILRVPLSERALEALRASRGKVRGPIVEVGRFALTRAWRRVTSKAGVPGIRFHCLRKTFVTNCRRRGLDLETTMTLSGHRDIATVLKVYREVDSADLLRAVGRGKKRKEAR